MHRAPRDNAAMKFPALPVLALALAATLAAPAHAAAPSAADRRALLDALRPEFAEQMHAFAYPCGLYEELTTGDGKPVDELCRQAHARERKHP